MTAPKQASRQTLVAYLMAFVRDHERTAMASYTVPGQEQNWREEWRREDESDWQMCADVRELLSREGVDCGEPRKPRRANAKAK